MLFAWQGPMIHLLTFHLNWRTTRGLRLPLLEDHEHFFCFFTAYWFDEIVYVHTILSSCLKVCTYYIHRKIHWVEKKKLVWFQYPILSRVILILFSLIVQWFVFRYDEICYLYMMSIATVYACNIARGAQWEVSVAASVESIFRPTTPSKIKSA